MSARYFALLTNIGVAKITNAAALGIKLSITEMAVGDGGGTLPTPTPNQTALINERRRAPINQLSIDPLNDAQIIVEQVIPENVGGWWIKEVGLYDEDGDLVAVSNCPETYKPLLQEGSGRTQIVRMVIVVSNTSNVTVKIDPAVVLATREYVDDKIDKFKNTLLSSQGGDHVNVTPIGLTAPRILSDYFSDRVDLRNVYGFIGDGRDESDVFEWAALKAKTRDVPLIIPEGSIVGLGSSVSLPVGTNIKINGQLRSLEPDMFSFIDSLFFESTITSGSLAGETFVIVADASGFKIDDTVALRYKYPTDDVFYNSIAQDPTQMGYQRQVMRIKRVDAGNKVVFGERILWDVPFGSTLSTVTEKATNIELSNSGKIVVAHNGYFIEQQISRLSITGGEIDFANISKGMRFSGSHFNKFHNVRFLNSLGGNTLFFGYGSCGNQISHSTFTGQQNGDSQLCFYAGGYGNSSSFNQFLNGDNTSNRGAIMFGAKTWNNMSIGDVVSGGFYGASSFFGAQRNVFRDTMLISQTYAGFFLEDSQHMTLANPQVTFPYANETEVIKGGIVLKACDGTAVEGGHVVTRGSPTVSMYDDPGVELQRAGLRINGLKTKGGDVKIYHAIKNLHIDKLHITNGSFIHYYAYNTESRGSIDLVVENGEAIISSLSYSTIKVKVDAGLNKPYGLTLRGFGVYSTVKHSHIMNATVAAYRMDGPYPQTSTCLDPHINTYENCPAYIEGGITQSITPVCPRLPPAGFYLPVNAFDPTVARTRMGYRAKGTIDTTYKQWAIIAANESTQ